MTEPPCFYCGIRMHRPDNYPPRRFTRTIDHIVPQSKIGWQHPGGPVWWRLNQVRACFLCNNQKADMWPLEWLEVMPEYGVENLVDRLLRLGCERAGIEAAVSARSERRRTG